MLSVNLFSCKNKTTEVAEPESGLIEITKAQFETEMMEFGKPLLEAFIDNVHITGMVVPSINGRAQISLPADGLVVGIYCKPGQLVRKGALLFEVAGNVFIDMQKDFAESAAQLNRLKSEYERQKELNDENIGVKKDLIMAESLYNVEKAKFGALKIKLEILGLDHNKIMEGSFYTSYSIKAPINGFMTNINASIGQYVEPQEVIAEIIDAETFQLKLSVFEADINKVKVGQNVEFYMADYKNKKYLAKINVVGKAIDRETKSVHCFAEIEDLSSVSLVNNQFVEGEIIIDTEMALSVPESAILKSENETYILAFERETDELYYLSKLKINPGRINKGFVELMESPNSKNILLKGVYNIQIE